MKNQMAAYVSMAAAMAIFVGRIAVPDRFYCIANTAVLH